MAKRYLVNPVDRIRSPLQSIKPLTYCIPRLVRGPGHSVFFPFAKPAFKPRNLISGRGYLKTQINRRNGLIGDKDALSEDFDRAVRSLSGHSRKDSVQAFVIPFGINFSKNFGDEEFQAA